MYQSKYVTLIVRFNIKIDNWKEQVNYEVESCT